MTKQRKTEKIEVRLTPNELANWLHHSHGNLSAFIRGAMNVLCAELREKELEELRTQRDNELKVIYPFYEPNAET
jgi:hypothetical protein